MSLEEIRAARAARKAELREKYEAQLELDLTALNDAEIEHGDNRVTHIEVPYVEGYPCMAIAKAPSEVDMKRYRAICSKAQQGSKTDNDAILEATRQIARRSVVYPSSVAGEGEEQSAFARMCAQWAGLEANLGAKAVLLHGEARRDEGNE